MSSPFPQAQAGWMGRGSTSLLPPPDYWEFLAGRMAGRQLERLRELSDERLGEFVPSALGPPEDTAVELLERVAADGWLRREDRRTCPNCGPLDLNEQGATPTVCPNCHEDFSGGGGIGAEIVYVRTLAPSRSVEWAIAIHGMNTAGAWQEALCWHLGTTWGQSVPVAVYKYGIVIAGVIMAWRRRTLQNELRNKLAALQAQARMRGFAGRPDVIAHSFGTWLFGHLLRGELARSPAERLTFGRVILTGCVLRPDFDWRALKAAGLVEDVLNHYGTKDRVVPLAHATIWDSGPSGRHGFGGAEVINVRAEGYGHSGLFSTAKIVVGGEARSPRDGDAARLSTLEFMYKTYWRPFLTLPRHELLGLQDRAQPTAEWRQLPWPLRGTLFPILALPLASFVVLYGTAAIGNGLFAHRAALGAIAAASAAGLLLLVSGIGVTALWRCLVKKTWR